MKRSIYKNLKVIPYTILSILIVFSLSILFEPNNFSAYASPMNSDASFEEAKKELTLLRDKNKEKVNKVTETYQQVEETTSHLFLAQQKLLKKRREWNDYAKNQYKNLSQNSLIYRLLNSEDFFDFLRNIDYANAAITYEFTMARDAEKQKDEYNSLLEKLWNQIDEQYSYLDECNKVNSDVNMMLISLKSKITAEQYAELQSLAHEITEIQSEAETALVRGEGLSDSLEDENSPVMQTLQHGLALRVNRPTRLSEDWSRGLSAGIRNTDDANFVSASDFPNLENEDLSEYGFIGVSVPDSWDNPEQFYNHLVRIKYNNCEVLGIINDSDSLASGSRALDIQSGLYEALGFKSADEYGVREIEYQIL